MPEKEKHAPESCSSIWYDDMLSLLTQQQQFNVLGRLDAILFQVPLNQLRSSDRSAFFSRWCATHDVRDVRADWSIKVARFVCCFANTLLQCGAFLENGQARTCVYREYSVDHLPSGILSQYIYYVCVNIQSFKRCHNYTTLTTKNNSGTHLKRLRHNGISRDEWIGMMENWKLMFAHSAYQSETVKRTHLRESRAELQMKHCNWLHYTHVKCRVDSKMECLQHFFYVGRLILLRTSFLAQSYEYLGTRFGCLAMQWLRFTAGHTGFVDLRTSSKYTHLAQKYSMRALPNEHEFQLRARPACSGWYNKHC